MQEANRNLKKLKQSKSVALKLLNQNNKMLVSNKFSKIIMSIIASKIKENISNKNDQNELDCKLEHTEKSKKMSMNELIEHILDQSECKTFS